MSSRNRLDLFLEAGDGGSSTDSRGSGEGLESGGGGGGVGGHQIPGAFGEASQSSRSGARCPLPEQGRARSVGG